jgi:predicted hydrocarbon binding protein
MFKEERKASLFTWSMLGDIDEGRPNLGNTTEVSVYRLMQFTLRDVLIQKFGVEQTDILFYEAGMLAGNEFFNNLIEERKDFNKFINELQQKLKDLRIGILRIEKADIEQMKFTLTVAEDLDCSGIPVTSEEICTYDEGFINGLLSSFTGFDFNVKEIDCWGSGDRVCRFDVKKNILINSQKRYLQYLKAKYLSQWSFLRIFPKMK